MKEVRKECKKNLCSTIMPTSKRDADKLLDCCFFSVLKVTAIIVPIFQLNTKLGDFLLERLRVMGDEMDASIHRIGVAMRHHEDSYFSFINARRRRPHED